MIGREPHEIWRNSLDGRPTPPGPASRRPRRDRTARRAFHVTLGLLALVVTTGALSAVMPSAGAHVLGSLTFGIGFTFLTIGRSELFIENFLIPGVAIAQRDAYHRMPRGASSRDRLSEELQATSRAGGD